MTLWALGRAIFAGAHVHRALAGLCGGPAAVLAGELLLLVGSAHAMTHARHAPVQSAGKAQAHSLHEASARSSRSSRTKRATEKAGSRHGRATDAARRSSATSRKSAPAPKHAREARSYRHDEDSRHTAKAHTSRKRREVQSIDDPQPIKRARNDSPLREPHGQFLQRKPAQQQMPAPEFHAARALSPEPAFSTPDGLPGNVARNKARHTARSRGEVLPDYEDSSQPSTTPVGAPFSSAGPSQPAPIPIPRAHSGVPMASVTAAPSLPAQPEMEPVEGFGGEVDFRSSPSSLGTRPTTSTTLRGSPAEQARDLREAAEAATQPMFVPMYSREGRLMVPPPLKGSRTILVHQNQMADDAGLTRIQDDADLNRLRRSHLLVDLPETASLRVNEGLPENRRSARPWAVQFAVDLAAAFYAHFGDSLQVNSAVRTVAYQRRLQRVNGNAAVTYGDGASPHLTGQALDFGKRGMNVEEIAWMRTYLLPLIDAGKIDVEEEFQQACFHISIYASYGSMKKHVPVRNEVAQVAARPVHAHVPATPVSDDDDMR